MRIGMVGLGRMGANMVRRLIARGHRCVVFNRRPEPVRALEEVGAEGVETLSEMVRALERPRAVWLMVPAGAVDELVETLAPLLDPGDTIIDGGNSAWRDDLARARRLAERGIRYVDVGVSGGVWGAERGYCLMIGGPPGTVAGLDPIFAALAPGVQAAPRTPGRSESPVPAERGYLHCGPTGAGHFVKMVHNGIEYGLMAAYAEGFNILRHADAGRAGRRSDAETTPLREPELYQYEFDLAAIAEVWRRGSVVSSWLLDLTAHTLLADPRLEGWSGRVSDSGEGRWTLQAAIEESVPAPVLSVALGDRFASRGERAFADRLLSALRQEFGGHQERQG